MSTRTEAIQSVWHLESRVPGRHFGLIVLDRDQATERDLMNMRPAGVSFYTTRIGYSEANTLENLKAAGKQLSVAASLILPTEKLDAIAYSCTSGTVALGLDEIASLIHSSRPGTPVVTPITAAFSAFDHLGVSRISLLTPYRTDVADLMVDFVQDHGYEVLNASTFHLSESSDLQRLSCESIVAGALATCRDDADALFISCTGIRAVDVVERIEEALGKPVVTSNQCMFWQCLKHAGYCGSINGYGRLLRGMPRPAAELVS